MAATQSACLKFGRVSVQWPITVMLTSFVEAKVLTFGDDFIYVLRIVFPVRCHMQSTTNCKLTRREI